MALTEHIELPNPKVFRVVRVSRAHRDRGPGQMYHVEAYRMTTCGGETKPWFAPRVLATFDDQAEALAAAEELQTRLSVVRALMGLDP